MTLYAVGDQGPVPTRDDTGELLARFDGGVYSGLRTYRGRFLRLDDHLARTEQSIRLSDWSVHLDRSALKAALDTLARAVPYEQRMRFEVLEAPIEGVHLFVGVTPLAAVPEQVLRDGARLAVAEGLRRERPLIKTTDFVLTRQSYVARDPSAYEHVMVGDDGQLLEGVTSNVYGVRDGIIHTAESGVLEGITRRIVLELAADLGIGVSFEPLRLAEVSNLDEAFLTSATREVVPISRIGDAMVGKPGPLTARLREAYQAYAELHAK